MTKKTFPMTKEGLDNLKLELEHLESQKQAEAKQRIKRARSFCDFQEDSEYEAALKGLSAIQERIATIKYMIQRVEVIEKANHGIVELGSTVTFKEIPDGEAETYTIVGAEEADAFVGKISHNSPMAKRLLGARVQDEVTIETPSGKIQVKIVNIS